MPTVLRVRGLRFFFYSNEHDPPHVHVTIGKTGLGCPHVKILLETFEGSTHGRLILAKKSEIHYGKSDLISDDLSPADAKVKVTIYLDGDLLLEARRRAKKQGKKYQRFINESLRDLFLNERRDSVDPKEFQRLLERVALLEKAIR